MRTKPTAEVKVYCDQYKSSLRTRIVKVDDKNKLELKMESGDKTISAAIFKADVDTLISALKKFKKYCHNGEANREDERGD